MYHRHTAADRPLTSKALAPAACLPLLNLALCESACLPLLTPAGGAAGMAPRHRRCPKTQATRADALASGISTDLDKKAACTRCFSFLFLSSSVYRCPGGCPDCSPRSAATGPHANRPSSTQEPRTFQGSPQWEGVLQGSAEHGLKSRVGGIPRASGTSI